MDHTHCIIHVQRRDRRVMPSSTDIKDNHPIISRGRGENVRLMRSPRDR